MAAIYTFNLKKYYFETKMFFTIISPLVHGKHGLDVYLIGNCSFHDFIMKKMNKCKT